MGHSCWVIAGTLSCDVIQGTTAQKNVTCMTCPVYGDYIRTAGRKGKEAREAFPDEEKKYREILHARQASR
jgi:hypothetical protein